MARRRVFPSPETRAAQKLYESLGYERDEDFYTYYLSLEEDEA